MPYVYLKFAIIPSVLFIFTEVHMQTERYQSMKHIKQDFSFKACLPSPCVNLRVWTEVNIQVFLEYGHVAYQIKEDRACQQHGSKCLPIYSPWPCGGVKRSKVYFFSTVMLHIKLNGMTNAVTCKQVFWPNIVKFRLFYVLVWLISN